MVDIASYINRQFMTMLPWDDGNVEAENLLRRHLPEATRRFRYCASHVNVFAANPEPDPWHVMKYPILLYFLGRTIFESGESDPYRVKDRLYCLNKALHGCCLSYKAALPKVFVVSYATGVVLGNCTYGENLVAYHGVTVGEFQRRVPELGSNVILMPHCVIAGDTRLGNNVVVSAGVRVINKYIPDNSIVFEGTTKDLVVKDIVGSEYVDTFFC